MKNLRKNSFILFVLLFTLIFSSSVFAYNDLPQDHWAYTAVSVMRDRGILHGYPDGNFYPDNNVTREEFAKIVVNTLQLTNNKVGIKYEDIEDGRWSKEFIDIGGRYFTAYKQGDKYFFKPEEASLREDVIVTTVLALKMENKEYDLDVLNQFSDRNTITPSLEKYVAIAVQNDLISGNANGTLNPQGNLTRAEVSQFMYNILIGLEIIEEEEEIVKIPVFDEIVNRKTVDFFATRTNVERDEGYYIELGTIDEDEVYEFADKNVGNELWRSAEYISGAFTIATINGENKLDALKDLDGKEFRINYDNKDEDISLELKYADNKHYTVQSMHNVKYDKDNKELVDLNGDSVTINSSVVVVKLLFDNKGTDKLSDDEYGVQFTEVTDEIKNLRNEYVIVINDSESRLNRTKYVVIFDEVATEKAEVGILADASENAIGEMLLTVSDYRITDSKELKEAKKDAMILNEKITAQHIVDLITENSVEMVFYTTDLNKDGEVEIIVNDVVLKEDLNLENEHKFIYLLSKDEGGQISADGRKARNEDITIIDLDDKIIGDLEIDEDYKFIVVNVELDDEDIENETQYVVESFNDVDFEEVKFKYLDRIWTGITDHVIIFRGFPERQ